jgi:hypothetical protein
MQLHARQFTSSSHQVFERKDGLNRIVLAGKMFYVTDIRVFAAQHRHAIERSQYNAEIAPTNTSL